MSRVLTFSTQFPAYHPKAGKETNFVEKIWRSGPTIDLVSNEYVEAQREMAEKYWTIHKRYKTHDFEPKNHTIRAGNRWKVGDKFSPRIWEGKPYHSRQIIISPDMEVKKIWDIKIDGFCIWIRQQNKSTYSHSDFAKQLALNDGLSLQEFWDWFPQKAGKFFTGQIICWNDKIEY